MMLTKTDDLRRFSESLLDEPRRIQPIMHDSRVLPERLIDHIISIRINRGDGDVTLRFRTAQHVRAKNNHVTRPYGFLPELTEQDRAAVTHDNDFHAVIGKWPYWPVHSLGSSE